MKKLTMVLAIGAMSVLLMSFASAQDQATQTFDLAVDDIYTIAVSGSPGDMTISTATPGSDPDPVTDATTSYSITHNDPDGAKITASLAPALSAGYTLTVALGGNPVVDISDGTDQDAVPTVAAGASTGNAIAYEFSATAAAGALASTGETVTLTVVGL